MTRKPVSVSFLSSAILLLLLNVFLQESYGSIIKGNQVPQRLSSQEEGERALFDVQGKSFQETDSIGKEEAHLRARRSMKEDIEKGFKEFSDKVARLPDQLTGSLKKYFEDRGISMESIQKILNDIWNGVEKLIEEIKKAM